MLGDMFWHCHTMHVSLTTCTLQKTAVESLKGEETVILFIFTIMHTIGAGARAVSRGARFKKLHAFSNNCSSSLKASKIGN